MRKFQNPKLEIRRDVTRPYYFIRVSIPRITVAGQTLKRERKPLGFVQTKENLPDEISRVEAMRRRAQALEVVNSGRMMIQSQVMFSDLLERFIAARVPLLGPACASRYMSHIKCHIRPAFGDRKLLDVDRQSIEAWLAQKEKDGLGWHARSGLRGLMSALFNAARDWRFHDGENPTTGVKIGRKKEKREKRLVTAEQIRMILAGVCERTRLMILTALLLGLRISEICGLRWEDFDFQAGTVEIKRSWSCRAGQVLDTKTEAGHRVLSLGPLVSEFERIRKPGGYVFADGANPVDERDILRNEVRPLLKRLGIWYAGFGFHAFRRANVSLRQTIGGATPIEAMKSAGHTRLEMTMLYSLLDADRDKEQTTRLYEHLMGTPKGDVQ